MTADPTTKTAIIHALAGLDTDTDQDAFTIPLEQAGRLAELLEPEFRRQRALGWHTGCTAGIKWAQGNADKPLRNPFETENDS